MTAIDSFLEKSAGYVLASFQSRDAFLAAISGAVRAVTDVQSQTGWLFLLTSLFIGLIIYVVERRTGSAGPVSIVKADVVGNGHLRVIAAGADGRRVKAIAFRMADSPLGEALLAAPPHRKLWLAGRIKRDDYTGGGAAELHLDDAAWADA